MGDAALNLAVPAVHNEASWPMRLAQQAFALLLEDSQRHSGFRVGARRASARAALSALSVDDRGPLERWLALQLVTSGANEATESLGVLATVDALLAAAVRAHLPRRVAELNRHSANFHVAA
jgi:hypothetical protein